MISGILALYLCIANICIASSGDQTKKQSDTSGTLACWAHAANKKQPISDLLAIPGLQDIIYEYAKMVKSENRRPRITRIICISGCYHG